MKLLKLSDKFEAGKYKGKTPSIVVNKGESKYLNYFLSRNKEYRLHKDVIKHAQSKTQLDMNKTIVDVLEHISEGVSEEAAGVAKKLLYLNKRKRIKSTFTKVKAYKSKKETIIFDIPFGNKRNEIKVGRFVRKIFEMNDIDFTERDIELFVSQYYSNVGSPTLSDAYFKVVKGEKIREYYHEDNYFKRTGSLIRSCARYDWYQSNLDFYVNNPSHINMVVLLDKETNKVKGRAIIWKESLFVFGNQLIQGTFMDRIYTNSDKDIALFKSWATEKGYIYKSKQSYDSQHSFIYNGTKKHGNIFSKIKSWRYNRPYFDTMVEGCFFQNNDKSFIGNNYEYDQEDIWNSLSEL